MLLKLVVVLLPALATAIRFHVSTNQKRCMKEEIHKDIVVTGEYEFSEAIGHTASVHVRIFFFSFKGKTFR